MNGQQYVRQLVESFGLQIPDGIQLVGDTLPIIIDLTILVMQKKATKENENWKTILLIGTIQGNCQLQKVFCSFLFL